MLLGVKLNFRKMFPVKCQLFALSKNASHRINRLVSDAFELAMKMLQFGHISDKWTTLLEGSPLSFSLFYKMNISFISK